jgi:hypothetical protein
MSVSVLGIDIAKQKFDAALLIDGKTKHKTCKNSAEGFEWSCPYFTGHRSNLLLVFLYSLGDIIFKPLCGWFSL